MQKFLLERWKKRLDGTDELYLPTLLNYYIISFMFIKAETDILILLFY